MKAASSAACGTASGCSSRGCSADLICTEQESDPREWVAFLLGEVGWIQGTAAGYLASGRQLRKDCRLRLCYSTFRKFSPEGSRSAAHNSARVLMCAATLRPRELRS